MFLVRITCMYIRFHINYDYDSRLIVVSFIIP